MIGIIIGKRAKEERKLADKLRFESMSPVTE